jgi:hypothetical protein
MYYNYNIFIINFYNIILINSILLLFILYCRMISYGENETKKIKFLYL